jgi:RNA polymerase sigma-70 factor (ECF subfamily)
VAAVLAGDREAFRLLVDRESPSVVRVCYRVWDLHEAEDAAQEAFVTAFRALATWRGDGPFRAWLARIALRIATSAPRATTASRLDRPDTSPRRTTRGLPWGERDDHAASIAGQAAHDPGIDRARSERAAMAVRDAVARLEEPYREIVALRFFADLSRAEIAVESGRPLGTVKTHLHRGLLRLRRTLEAEGA